MAKQTKSKKITAAGPSGPSGSRPAGFTTGYQRVASTVRPAKTNTSGNIAGTARKSSTAKIRKGR